MKIGKALFGLLCIPLCLSGCSSQSQAAGMSSEYSNRGESEAGMVQWRRAGSRKRWTSGRRRCRLIDIDN